MSGGVENLVVHGQTGSRVSFHAAVFIAVSLDGFIARPDGAIDWLTERGERAGETGYDEFMAAIDTVVLGRNTYEKVLTFGFWPYEGKQVEVLSTTLPLDVDERVIVHRTVDAQVQTRNDRGPGWTGSSTGWSTWPPPMGWTSRSSPPWPPI